MSEFSYLAALNGEQQHAVQTVDGPLLVLSGAGTGKTRVLTTRIMHILHLRKAMPQHILAVTFTNKAAREMLERINNQMPVEGLWLGTFHAIAARMLRRNAELVGLPQQFVIIDADDQLRLIKSLMQEQNIDSKKIAPKAILGAIQRWKDVGLTPDQIVDTYSYDEYSAIAQQIYPLYQLRLVRAGAVDFGDLLLHMLTIFAKHPDVLASYQQQFRYILVDEYQDTNVGQYMWLKMLAGVHKNICCVGDDDQSIYGWRGADIGNILKFEQDFPGAHIIRLEQNYRSTAHILAAASTLIACNQKRLGKTLWTEKQDGEKIKLVALWDDREEARYVANEIDALQQTSKEKLSQIAILVRASFQTRAFEEAFVHQGIGYRVIGGLRFYERMEIRDAIAYIRAILRPDDDLALERIINTPKRGLGDASLEPLRSESRRLGCSFAQAIERSLASGHGKSTQTLRKLLDQFATWRAAFANEPHATVVERILSEVGYIEMWKKEHSIEAEGRIENLKEFVQALAEFPDIGSFLEHVSLVMDNEANDKGEKVSLMTLHAAKGLEFDTVFLPGWEEGVFPHARALEESGSKGLEEERRLAYVGITRARRRLYICYAANRRVYNQWQSSIPSRFVKELPEDAIEQILPAGELHYYPTRTSAGKTNMENHRQVREKLMQPSAPQETSAGGRVFHQKFGYGKVIAAEGDQLDILFDKAGRKRILDSFIEKV